MVGGIGIRHRYIPLTQVTAAAVVSAITDQAAVIAKATELRDAGEVQLALHVIDVLALADGADPIVVEARKLKSELLRLRRWTAFVSKSLYESSAGFLTMAKQAG